MRPFLFYFVFTFLHASTIPFHVGESLHYQASFSGIDAATGTLEVLGRDTVHNSPTIHIRFTAKTYGFAKYLFRIQDEINFWLDEETLFPLKVHKDIREGNYKKKTTIHLNQKDGFAIVNKDSIPITEETHSPYSLFYYLRNLDLLSIHGDIFYTIDGKKVTPLKMIVEDSLSVEVPVGQFQCTKVTPTRTDQKKFKNEATMSIWFSDDKKRYPVKIWIKMKFGAFVLKLDEIVN